MLATLMQSRYQQNSDRWVKAFRGAWTIALACCLHAWTVPAGAQADFPSRPLQIIVPFPAGGSADYFARTVFNKIGEAIDRPIVIENKPGAGGIIGAKMVISSPTDGYTLLVSAVTSVLIPPNMTSPVAFDALKDLSPITGIGTVPAVLVVKPSLGTTTFSEFVKYAAANPGKLNLATSGAGTISHLTGELLMQETGVTIVPVHYRGAPPAVTDLLGGHADLMFSDAPFFLEHVRAGKLIPLAIGAPQRSLSLPDTPTTAELGFPNIVASNTYSLFAPPKTATEILTKLNQLVRAALSDAQVQAGFAAEAAIPAASTREHFVTLIENEARRWLPLVKSAGLKAN